jgi:membrane protein involved in D-alanine export
MGVWHGTEWYYLVYGLYHAALLCGYDWFARWNKTRHWLSGGWGWHTVNIALTFHAIAFGLLLFSGRLVPRALPEREEIVEKLTCFEISGYVWNRNQGSEPVQIDFAMDGQTIGRVTANELREDLLEKGYTDGRHGFRFELPASVRDGREHWIVPVIVGQSREISGPHIIKCPPQPAPAATPVPVPAR